MAEPADNQESWKALGLRTDIPHPARVYDYMLGGRDNFAADREMAERGLQLVPEMRDSSRGNRDFLIRAVAFARDAGIRQFLDIGTGLPISPNTHEVARLGHPDARVVYVDNDRCKSGCAHACVWRAGHDVESAAPVAVTQPTPTVTPNG